MDSGLIFYWLGWIVWIIVTFLMKKSRTRTQAACIILLTIAFSEVYINVAFLEVSAGFLIMGGIVLILHSRLPRILFHTFAAFSAAIGYMGLLIWLNFTPIQLFLPPLVVGTVFLLLLLTTLIKEGINRLISGSLGLIAGEIGYNLLVSNYGIPGTIGDMVFFDRAVLVLVIIFVYNSMFKLNTRVSKKVTSNKQTLRKHA